MSILPQNIVIPRPSAPADPVGDAEPVKPEPTVQEAKADPIAVSNTAFLDVIFKALPEDLVPLVRSKRGDPTEGGWFALPMGDVDSQCPSDANNYFNCSSFLAQEDGSGSAKIEHFGAYHALVLDDVGTKVSRDRLEGFTPTWEIETSPGNYQVGVVLDPPLRSPAEVTALQQAVMAAELCDKGAGGKSRWMRLPDAINGKAKYRDHAGHPFRCRLAVWKPEVTYTLDELEKAMGITLASVAAKPVTSNAIMAQSLRSDDIFSPAPAINPVIVELKSRGLYKVQLAPGKHDITCPWVEEHTDAIDSGTAYFEPDEHYPQGGFRCQHSHGDHYHVGQLIEHLGLCAGDVRGKPRIRCVAGELDRIVKASELALALRGQHYCHENQIATVRTDPETGEVRIELTSEQALARDLSAAATFERRNGNSPQWVRCDPPLRVVQALLRGQDFVHLPRLKGVARQPYFREKDGVLVTEPGYDAASGIYASFDAAKFQFPEPTREEAEKALGLLDSLLAEFHFACDADRAATLSAMLTAAVRPTLAVAPAFNITASSYGSGKSYLAATIAPFAGPGLPLNASFPATSEEATKVALALFMQSPAVINFDDMQEDWKPHGAFNRMLTSPTISDRVLGSSRAVSVSTRALVMGTGNNIEPVRDMCRRVISITLAPRAESPATLSYTARPVDLVRENREAYVVAALTIVGAWKAAGSPRAQVCDIATYGSQWADYCRHPLIWLGTADPATSLLDQIKSDPDREALGHLMTIWHSKFGSAPMTVRKLLDQGGHEIMVALSEFPVLDRSQVNHAKVGWFFRKNSGRIVNGLEIRAAQSSERKAWRVVKVADLRGD